MLSENIRKIQALAPKAKVLPMVKGDAYGHGIIQISRWLYERCGMKRLGVAALGEAETISSQLHNFAEDPETSIVVFSDTEIRNPELRKAYLSGKIIPVMASVRDVEELLSAEELRSVQLFLKVNTGMNRLGVSLEELAALAPVIKEQRGSVDHLLQHFAHSWVMLQPGDTTSIQIENFAKAKELLKQHGVGIGETSMSNSAAIEQGIGVEETWVRPGLMMYGPPSVVSPKKLWDGHQISAFVTKIVQRYFVEKGASVGYGNFPVPEDAVVAMLPVGYADGMIKYYTGASITVNGEAGKIHGNVNMDMTALIFPAPTPERRAQLEAKINVEDKVYVWDHNNDTINSFAQQVDTNCYQLMCGLTIRLERLYVGL